MTTPDPWTAPGEHAPDPYAAPDPHTAAASSTPTGGIDGAPQPAGPQPTAPPVQPSWSPQPDGTPAAYAAPADPQGYATPADPQGYATPQGQPYAQQTYGQQLPVQQPPYAQQPPYPQQAYGQPQYASPQYASPQHTSPQYTQYPQPGTYPPGAQWAQPQKTNGMAIASLIVSLAGILTVGATGILGLIFGIVALRQISRTGDAGKGMAIAGIVVGSLMVVFFLFVVIVVITTIATGNVASHSGSLGASTTAFLTAATGSAR